MLIHSGQPWLDEGAYVASILPHVYLEMSIMMPWASLAIDTKLEALLGIAPPSKVLYGSDEASEPEVLWLSAQVGREALERVLGDGGGARLARRRRGASRSARASWVATRAAARVRAVAAARAAHRPILAGSGPALLV